MSLDNLKFLMIVFVFFGHLIEGFRNDNELLKVIYTYIYFFHIPIFVYISGYFSKKCAKGDYFNLLPILFLYLFFQFLYVGSYSFLRPDWIMWYLFSLFAWKLILPYFVRLKHPIIYTLIFSLLAGLFEEIGYFLSLSRTIYFFPFFLLGYYSQKEQLKKLTNSNSLRFLSYFSIIASFILVFFISQKIELDYRVLYGSYSYLSLGFTSVSGVIIRLADYAIALFFLFIFLNIVPKKETVISYIGKNCLAIYLLHGFIVLFLRNTFLEYIPGDRTFTIIFIAILVTGLFTFIFGQKVFQTMLEYVKHPQLFLEEKKTPKT